MHRLAVGSASALALAIIAIGIQYLVHPRAATRSFGLPLPEDGPNVAWWLRLKGVRDVVSGLAVLAFVLRGEAWAVGLLLLVDALIPAGDMLTILAAKGSAGRAFGIHGLTVALMVLTAAPLAAGA